VEEDWMRVGLIRVAGAVFVAGASLVAMALPAWAHVTMHSYEAQAGGSDALISFRTPNEESNATTTTLEVDFPAATPLIGLYVEPMPGWQFQVTTSNLPKPVTNGDGTFSQYVSKVVWSGGNIPVGGYQDFNVDVSDLPNVPMIEVKALQTYSNGDIVRWIDDPTNPNAPHPAPTLALTPAPPAGGAGSTTTTSPAPTVSLHGLAKTSEVNRAKNLSIIALLVGIVGVLAAAAALATRRRPAGS
jgi:uncharacterized protein YcnI